MTRVPRLHVQALLFLVYLGVTFVALARPLVDTDLWWHLANGRYILAHGVPTVDQYSHTATGHVWVVHEWLADVLFYLLYQLGGLPLLEVLCALGVTYAMYLVYRLLRLGGLGNNPAVLLGILLLVASSPSFGPRPQVLNLVLTAWLAWRLVGLRAGRPWSPWRLLPLFVLWANLHSGYLVGVGVLAVFVAAEAAQVRWSRLASARAEGAVQLSGPQLRSLAMMVPLGLLCGLLTPATWRTVVFALGTLSSSSIQQFIVEWSSPDFHQVWGRALLVVLLVLVAGLVRRRSADPTYVALGLAGVTLALTSQRHVPIFAALGAPLLGEAAAGLLDSLGVRPRPARPAPRSQARVNGILLVVLCAGGLASVLVNLRPASVARAVAAAEPVGATDWLLANHPAHELFNEYRFGGWLAWKAPDYRVFIDGRIEVYGDQVFSEYLRAEYLAPTWYEPLDRYHVNTVMLSRGDRLGLLLPARGWRQAYQDGVAEVWVRG